MTILYKMAAVGLSLCLAIVLFGCGNVDMKVSQQGVTHEVPKIGVQLWSVKEELKRDFKNTLITLSEQGFEGVEFAGEFGSFAENPEGLKTFLNSLNLQVSAAHTGFANLAPEAFDETVAFYQTLGVDTLIIAWDERAWSEQGVDGLVAELNGLAEKLAPHQMRIGFHNHDKEFNSYLGETFWDYIAKHTSPEVVLQLDVGWVRYAGHDPVTFVNRYPGRTLTSHFKIRVPPGSDDLSPVIGRNPKNRLNWVELIRAETAVGGTRWFIVEQEEFPQDTAPLEAVIASKKGLIDILERMNLK